ncbi:MAG TPA: nucleoside triphosphate pyrophosphohydrolase [Beijerinckiaceae bacterium]|nr:nucleoside triphosphate pyrophosphohydrolase [Beijerinckiaceae bacterium]HVB89654.1 nucleoside triphosphate pyrophosphohydrolase [Beijerinckiaceae bacterium]
MPAASRDVADLLDIMARLRTPEIGCPWDLEQDFSSIAPYTIEEAYEVADAIERGDFRDLAEELGDLLLQVVFHARMAEERALFSFGDVVEAVTAKLIRRHPHVFAQEEAMSAAAVKQSWAAIKAREKAQKALESGSTPGESAGLLADVPSALPALTRAVKLQARASTVGFDWREAAKVVDKIEEETDEIRAALKSGDKAQIEEEIGDLLFAVANLARHLDADPEACARAANAKFARRFAFIERELAARGQELEQTSLDEMEAIWIAAKRAEKEPPPGSP